LTNSDKELITPRLFGSQESTVENIIGSLKPQNISDNDFNLTKLTE
jgi:hypothetical protein